MLYVDLAKGNSIGNTIQQFFNTNTPEITVLIGNLFQICPQLFQFLPQILNTFSVHTSKWHRPGSKISKSKRGICPASVGFRSSQSINIE